MGIISHKDCRANSTGDATGFTTRNDTYSSHTNKATCGYSLNNQRGSKLFQLDALYSMTDSRCAYSIRFADALQMNPLN